MNYFCGEQLIARGEEYGKCEDLYFDDETWRLRYIVATTGPFLFRKSALLAPEALSLSELESCVDGIPLNVSKQQIQEAPEIDSDNPVSRQKEQELFAHYNWLPYWKSDRPANDNPETQAPLSPPPVETSEGDPNLRSLGEVVGYAAINTTSKLGTLKDMILDVTDFSIPYLVIDTKPKAEGGLRMLSTRLADNEVSFDFESKSVHSSCSVYHLLENPSVDVSDGRLSLGDQRKINLANY